MSFRAEIKGKIQDFEALKGAIEHRLQGTLHEDSAISIFGRKCQHHATFPNEYYKLGIMEQEGEYDLIYDNMLRAVGGSGAGKLLDAYNMEKSLLEANAMGYATNEYTEQDGTSVIEIYVTEY